MIITQRGACFAVKKPALWATMADNMGMVLLRAIITSFAVYSYYDHG